MRIGILTVPFNNNYGGFLQAFALKTVLTGMGHKVVFINRRPNRMITLRIRIGNLLRTLHFLGDNQKKISRFTKEFEKEYLFPYTKEYYSTQELRKCLKYKFDCVIVGSDQVWRYRYFRDWIDDFFCNFLEGTNIPHFSYAASMGTDEMDYPQSKREVCARLLKSFNKISVREDSSVKLLREYFGVKEAQVVLDPTLLLDKHVYVGLFNDKYSKPKRPYIFSYILDDSNSIHDSIIEFSHQKNLSIIDIKAQTGSINDWNVIEPVEKWLSAIYYADYVITDSFHGTVFSLLFNKQFIVYGNIKRGLSRMQDMLGHLELIDRLLTSNDAVGEMLEQQIDWNPVNNRICAYKDSSLSFLKDVLYSLNK